jgi:hypothetical protein
LQIIADTHTHTVACDHAFSTIAENAAAAKERGLRFLCMTEHGSTMAGAPSHLYFDAQHNLVPPTLNGVVILKGGELNIMNDEGELDLPEDGAAADPAALGQLRHRHGRGGFSKNVKEVRKPWRYRLQSFAPPSVEMLNVL